MNYGSWSGKAGRAIRALLAERRESIESLSEGTGLALSTLKRRLLGVSPFTIDEIGIIANHFEVPITALLVPFSDRALEEAS